MLVDDQDLAVLDDVLLVPLEQFLRTDRVVQEAHERGVDGLVQVLHPEPVLDLLDTCVEDADRALLDVDLVVLVLLEAPDEFGEVGVPLGRLVGGTADDQRRTGLVDEDRVHLVDDREVVAALDHLVDGPRHVVAQVVEAELVVRAVGDVRGVRLASLLGSHLREDHADLEPEEPVHPAHPRGVSFGEIVVHRDDMDALAGQCVEVRGKRRNEGLTLTGLHLGDVAEVQCRPTHDLDVIVALTQCAARGLADCGEGLREQIVEGLTSLEPGPELRRQLPQFLVAHRFEVVLEGVDLHADGLQLAQDLAFARPQDLV